MKIAVTGAGGFIGRNLCLRLREKGGFEILEIGRDTRDEELFSYISSADFVFHLAGVNRPTDTAEFIKGNVEFTKRIVSILEDGGRKVPIVLSSSSQAEQEGPYGASKLAAEEVVKRYALDTGAAHYIYRLPNVFGKWCKPDYNSFVATFCSRIMIGAEIEIHNRNAAVKLAYIDDVCESFLALIEGRGQNGYCSISEVYDTTVGEVADIISSFNQARQSLLTGPVGRGLSRALYATYLSYANPMDFTYELKSHEDERGVFCEMLRTQDSGQFSFFTAHPGVTRGGHYHHTKNEKFLVIQGDARFSFRNVLSDQTFSTEVCGGDYKVVETIPGWVHNITNIGNADLIVMLWANEVFDPERPDTIGAVV